MKDKLCWINLKTLDKLRKKKLMKLFNQFFEAMWLF